ncbi:MAG: alpha-amylase family glycosyl hydrolase [Clostridium sp.]|nr:alpha-amylase family glycosyl hydrolase [Clostridium sp.]
MLNWKSTCFKPDRQEEALTQGGVRFAANMLTDEECGVILYDGKGKYRRFPFSREGKQGTLYGLEIEGEGLTDCAYNYYVGEETVTSPYAREIHGLEKWGEEKEKKRQTYGVLRKHVFDWQGDEPLAIPLKDSIFYGLNVRAFTMHRSSGVRRRGTFEGVAEKIPYLKELGITAVVLMPCYEYDECMIPEKTPAGLLPMAAAGEGNAAPTKNGGEVRLNCWGFQKGYYFAPKAAYSAGAAPVISFKTLVREMHRNGIEVIMQFYFPPETGQLYVLDVIKYWVTEYHIDGARINGFSIPYRLLAEEPVLKNTKIWCDYLPEEDLNAIKNPIFKNFISNNGNYRNDIRRFLKGDEGMVNQMLFYQRRNPDAYGVVNYLADYDGFSLYDCVSYEGKHNETNGEQNRDGTDKNFTWNCGVEGDSRRKSIQELRLKQLKNALSFIFLGQGIPFIFSGDEFASSRSGNNNCYCQDNATGWVNWKNNSFSNEVLACARFLIRLRKAHPILHMEKELQIMDSLGCGYPDISYHGLEAWKPDMSYMSRIAGILLCGKYAPKPGDNSIYIAYNMHWEKHDLALPKADKNRKWVKIADSSLPVGFFTEKKEDCSKINTEKEFVTTINGRSIAIFKTIFCGESGGKKKSRGAAKGKQ